MTIDPGAATVISEIPGTASASAGQHGESLWRGAWRRLRRSPMAIVGTAIMVAFVAVAVFAPWLAPYEPASKEWTELSTFSSVLGHSSDHLLGVDTFGSDMLTQLIYGARQSLVIGVVSTLIGFTAGATVGALAGAFGGLGGRAGGWVDSVLMRFVDVLLAVPSLILAISIAAVTGRNSWGLMLAIGAAQIPIFARLLRGSMMGQTRSDYVLAAGALGLRKRTIALGEVLPNSIGPTIVQATLNLGTAIIEVAALTYLGLGSSEPAEAEWGRMIVAAQERFSIAPWLAFYPGIAIAITALGFTLFGEALREALDPKQRR